MSALSEKTLAILGTGMMGGALARGLVRARAMSPAHIRLFDTHTARAQSLAVELGQGAVASSTSAAAIHDADLILLAVKPPVISDLLGNNSRDLSLNQLVISIAAGVRLSKMEALLPTGVPVVRAMPNTPCLASGRGLPHCAGVTTQRTHTSCWRGASSRLSESPSRWKNGLMDAVTGLFGVRAGVCISDDRGARRRRCPGWAYT